MVGKGWLFSVFNNSWQNKEFPSDICTWVSNGNNGLFYGHLLSKYREYKAGKPTNKFADDKIEHFY